MQDWHHVPETPNPANKVSRGLGPSSLTADHRRLRVPNFPWQPETCWPNEVHGNVLDDSLELKKKKFTYSLRSWALRSVGRRKEGSALKSTEVPVGSPMQKPGDKLFRVDPPPTQSSLAPSLCAI